MKSTSQARSLSQPKVKKRKWFRLFFLHRYTGLIAAVFAVFLSITGILLNHTEEFGLSDHQITTSWLMRVYGIESPDVTSAYPVRYQDNEAWVAQLGDTIYFNQHELNCHAQLTGAIVTQEVLVVSNDSQLCLFALDISRVQLIDHLSIGDSIKIKGLGLDINGNTLVDTSTGIVTINADFTDIIPHQALGSESIGWKKTQTPPDSISTTLKNQYQGKGLPLERIILDLHSGRVVGLAGVYFMDFIGLLLIFLAFTGVMMWSKKAVKKKNKKRKRQPQ